VSTAQWLFLALAALLSWTLTGAVRRYALAHSVLDLPNERSMHKAPVPRGGGLAIAIVTIVGLGLASVLRWAPASVGTALAGGAFLVAAVGWWDDHRGLSPRWRAVCHFVAAAWAVSWLGGLPEISLGSWSARLGFAGSVLAVVAIVWCINLYNFMDGIDGLAAAEAMVVGLLGGALLLQREQPGLAFVALLVAAGCAGFLPWNWTPARIFMGDIGSGLLGFLFAALAVASERMKAVPGVVWAIILAAFVIDATLTLVRRVLRKERWYEGHRSHAYQRAVSSGLSHAHVTQGVVLLTIVLGGLGWFAIENPGLTWLVAVVAFGCVIAVYHRVERMHPM
jgi:Fuc2NAc and GlcNAc transferase